MCTRRLAHGIRAQDEGCVRGAGGTAQAPSTQHKQATHTPLQSTQAPPTTKVARSTGTRHVLAVHA